VSAKITRGNIRIEEELLGEPIYGLFALARGEVPDPPLSAETNQLIRVVLALDTASGGDQSELHDILTQAGFAPLTISFLIKRLVPRGRGRPSRTTMNSLNAKRLAEIKSQLRQSGVHTGIHERAFAELEAEYSRICKLVSSEFGISAPTFDREGIENYSRRSKRSRKKSRAK
jgi:hypothetical protein